MMDLRAIEAIDEAAGWVRPENHVKAIAEAREEGRESGLIAIAEAVSTNWRRDSSTTTAARTATTSAAILADRSRPVEQRCADVWRADPETRREFFSLANFIAFTKAAEAGRVGPACCGQGVVRYSHADWVKDGRPTLARRGGSK